MAARFARQQGSGGGAVPSVSPRQSDPSPQVGALVRQPRKAARSVKVTAIFSSHGSRCVRFRTDRPRAYGQSGAWAERKTVMDRVERGFVVTAMLGFVVLVGATTWLMMIT